MNVRAPDEPELIDVLERVVEAGVCVEPWLRIASDGIDLVGTGQRIVPEAEAGGDSGRHQPPECGTDRGG